MPNWKETVAEQVAHEKLNELGVNPNTKWGKAMLEVARDAFFLAVDLQNEGLLEAPLSASPPEGEAPASPNPEAEEPVLPPVGQ
jgi:hypothetical protein